MKKVKLIKDRIKRLEDLALVAKIDGYKNAYARFENQRLALKWVLDKHN